MSAFNETLFIDREIKLRGFQKLLRPDTSQAIMLIRADEDMGKTWLTLKMQHECQKPEVNLPVARLNFRDPLDLAKITDYLSLLRLLRDRLNLGADFNRFNETINRLTEPGSAKNATSPLAKFAKVVEERYSLAELERLTRFLDVRWDNLPGEILADKAYQLVKLLTEGGQIDRLLARLAEERSTVQWRELWATLQAESTPTPPETPTTLPGDTPPVVDRNLPLPPLSETERTYAERQLTETFFACLTDIIAAHEQIILLFDSFETAPAEARRLLRQELLLRLQEPPLRNLVLIVTGRETPDVSDLQLDHLLATRDPVPLEAFSEQYVREFMTSRNVSEAPPHWTFQGALALSGGVPGLLARMADRVRAEASSEDDFFKDA